MEKEVERVIAAARAVVDKQAWCSVYSVGLIPALADALRALDVEIARSAKGMRRDDVCCEPPSEYEEMVDRLADNVTVAYHPWFMGDGTGERGEFVIERLGYGYIVRVWDGSLPVCSALEDELDILLAAMEWLGYDDEDVKAVEWLFESSWGDAEGEAGREAMGLTEELEWLEQRARSVEEQVASLKRGSGR